MGRLRRCRRCRVVDVVAKVVPDKQSIVVVVVEMFR